MHAYLRQCNVAFVLGPIGATYRTQEEVSIRDPGLELPARMLSEVKFPIHGQKESVIDDDRVSLDDQVISMSEDPGYFWIRRNGS
jgi:hypothetical protein